MVKNNNFLNLVHNVCWSYELIKQKTFTSFMTKMSEFTFPLPCQGLWPCYSSRQFQTRAETIERITASLWRVLFLQLEDKGTLSISALQLLLLARVRLNWGCLKYDLARQLLHQGVSNDGVDSSAGTWSA